MFHKLLYEKVKFNIILTSVHQKLSSSGQQRNKIKFSTNKNKKKKQLKGLKFISDSTIIFFYQTVYSLIPSTQKDYTCTCFYNGYWLRKQFTLTMAASEFSRIQHITCPENKL